MAAAANDPAAFEGDDEFDDYNPHPYQGGYDIALTYGQPLPPSPTTCFPLSQGPRPQIGAAPDPKPLSNQDPPPPEPKPAAPRDYGDAGARHQDPRPEPHAVEPLAYWPFTTWVDDDISCRRDQTGEPGYWSQWRRAADYLFGYSQGYGERWAGTDSYGIPIYANKRQAEASLVVQLEPARSQKLDYYQDGPSQNGGRDYNTADAMYTNQSYDDVYDDEVGFLQKRSSSSYIEWGDESVLSGTPNFAYYRHYYEEPVSVQVNEVEMASTHRGSYYEDNYEDAATKANLQLTYDNEPLEPFEPSWSRIRSYYEVYGEEVPSEYKGVLSPYGEQGNQSLALENFDYAYANCYHEQSVEPYKPAWPQNPTYYDTYEEKANPSPAWFQNSTYYDTHENTVFPGSQSDHYIDLVIQGDDSHEEIAAQLFSPFQTYLDYGE